MGRFRRQSGKSAHRPQVESLPPRLLLSARLFGTQILVDGTDGDDVIIIGANKRFVNVVTVTFNDTEQSFSLSAVQSYGIRCGAGDDKVWIDSALDSLAWPAYIEGEDGDDMITCGAAKETVTGGAGADRIYGNAGADKLDGGTGRDSVWGGSDNDIVTGGPGNDRLIGEGGNDVFYAGKGNDYCEGGDGNDTFTDDTGVVNIDAGAGNDNGSVAGSGVVHGGAGDDAFVAPGGALLYGEAGNDNLQSSWVDGGDGNDTLSGLLGDDEVHGGGGDDLIRGFSGSDVLIGDDGNDAIFGGSDTDTLYGGTGNDNLYGTDGFQDKHPELAGSDDALGERGSDWFETNYHWNTTDRRGDTDRPVNSQNPLTQDPSSGQYLTGSFTSNVNSAGGTLRLSGGSSAGIFDGSGSLTTTNGNLNVYTGNTGTVLTSTIQTTSLGPAGWLSSGAYDTASGQFVPPMLTHKERLAAERVILQIPATWNLGPISTTGDDIVWYQVYVHGASAPAPSSSSNATSLTLNGGTLQVSSVSSLQDRRINVSKRSNVVIAGTLTKLGAGTYQLIGNNFLPVDETTPDITNITDTSGDDTTYAVPALDGGTVYVNRLTPHLYDGVADGVYRFLGVKRGTILMSGTGSKVDDANWLPLTSSLLLIPPTQDIRLAGDAKVYHTLAQFDDLPAGGPKLRGIAVEGGAIWLPLDGSAPYFSSGKN